MSTRSIIVAKTETGYAGIYCHSDGYPAGVGKRLLDHYQDPQKVAELIALGDISVLRERVHPTHTGSHSFDNREPGVTVAYGRDRSERNTAAATSGSLASLLDNLNGVHDGHIYVFDGQTWTHNSVPLAEAVELDLLED